MIVRRECRDKLEDEVDGTVGVGGKLLAKEVNPTVYDLAKRGILGREKGNGSRPLWRLASEFTDDR